MRTSVMSLLLLGTFFFGCGAEAPPQPPTSTPPIAPVETSAGSGQIVTQMSCEIKGDATDAAGRPVVYPFAKVHVRATFRVENRAAAERLMPVVYFVKFSQKRGNDVIYQGYNLEKSFDGDLMTVEAHMPTPSKAGEFRVEFFNGNGGYPGSIFGRSALIVEERPAQSGAEGDARK